MEKALCQPKRKRGRTPRGVAYELPIGRDAGTPQSFNQSFIQADDYRECTAAKAAMLAKEFRLRGFCYEGSGSLEGLIARRLKEGYSEEQLRKAFAVYEAIPPSQWEKIKDHAAYFLTVLDSQNPYGP